MAFPSLNLLSNERIAQRGSGAKHQQLRDELRALMDLHFEEGQQFWPEMILTEHLQLSRGTVRRALEELAKEGRLQRLQAKGSIVRRRPSGEYTLQSLIVFVTSYDSELVTGTLQQFREQSEEQGIEMQIVQIGQNDPLEALTSKLQAPPDRSGLVFLTEPNRTYTLYAALSPLGYRTITLESPGQEYLGPIIETNAALAVHIGVQYLAALGHRKIVYLVNEPGEAPSVARKMAAFQSMDGTVDGWAGEIVVCGTHLWDDSYYAAYEHMPEVWERCPSAIFTASDRGAWAALKWLAERGVRVPEEVSVLGFEGLQSSEYVYPALTTIAHPIKDQVRQAIEMIRNQMQGVMQLAPLLIVRHSTGPAPIRPSSIS